MSDSLLHPCARCAGMQLTCCQRAEIVLTRGDLERIAKVAPAGDFHEWRAPKDASYSELDEEDPQWVEWTVRADGRRRVLKRRENGDCTFLGEHGCRLEENTRPLVCRLYPFDYTHAGIQGEASEYCPSAVLRPPEGQMSVLLGMRKAAVELWRQTLYHELQEDHEVDARRTDLRPT